jgi:hypothetical protein
MAAELRDDGWAPIRLRIAALQACYDLRRGAELGRDRERELRHQYVQRRRQLEAAARLYGAWGRAHERP